MKKDSEQYSVDISLDKIKDWVSHHPKQLIGIAVIVVLIIIFAATAAASNNKKKDDTEGGYSSASETEMAQSQAQENVSDTKAGDVVTEYSKAAEEDAVKQLVNRYYEAYAAGDVAAVEACATPISEMEKGYIAVFSQYAESYQDIEVYLKGGYEENSYFVSVVYNLKFADIETLDPGMDFFYVRTAKDGNVYIDNIYSNFNMSSEENDVDANVAALIAEFEKAEDVIALQKEVQKKYDEALSSDEALNKMMNETLSEAVRAWAKEYNAKAQAAAEAEAQAKAEAEAKAAAEAEAQAKAEAKAAAEAEAQAKAEAEAQAAAEAQEAESQEEENSHSQSYFDEGDVIQLTAATNIRVSMSETADKVGVAFAGESVTVIQSYAEGWTKVSWNEKTGYVKTEVLLDQ